ncbi:hypothetical protein N7456_008083, partial [Penicillium angulare]
SSGITKVFRWSPGCLGRITRAVHNIGTLSRESTFKSQTADQMQVLLSCNRNVFGIAQKKYAARLFTSSCQRYGPRTMVRVPSMAESITEGTLAQFSRKVGDFVEEDEELATIETDKIDVSVNSPHSGIICQLLVREGDTVSISQEIAEIEAAEKKAATTQQKGPPELQNEISVSSGEKVQHSHLAHRPLVMGTGELRTTTIESTSERSTQKTPPPDEANKPQELKGNAEVHGETRVKMTRIRQKTAQHLKQSQENAAFLTTFSEVDMSRIMEFRKNNRDAVLEKHGVKLGFMGAMALASALSLKQIPAVNASIENGDTIVYRDYVDLSVAAAIPKGLVTPVLRNVGSMSIIEIEKGIADLASRARNGKLKMDDLKGGTFTISNSGIWGSLFGTPIINMPQSAVLGTYGIQNRPMAIDGRVEIRPMMYIALTYDHRLIDGREAGTFLNLVKSYLERPESMLLD